VSEESLMGPAPLTVGVTGHRDLTEEASSRFGRQIREIFTKLRSELPHTPIVLLTGLAEGADRIAAQIALDQPGVTCVAALPLPIGDYVTDFESESRADFWSLLERCDYIVEVGSLPDEAAGGRAEVRERAYQHFGRWLGRNSQILVAGWDGDDPKLPGGTADNVFYKAEGLAPLPDLSDDDETLVADPGLILWVPVARKSADSEIAVDEAIKTVGYLGECRDWDGSCGTAPANMELFNREAAGFDPDGTATEVLFRKADSVAAGLQLRYRWLLRLILASGVAALAGVDVMQSTGNPWAVVFVVSCLVSATISWAWLLRSRWRDRFQQARALAEGARIQSVWLAAHIRVGPGDLFLASQGKSVEWIRCALRWCWVIDRESRKDDVDLEPARQWLVGQVEYFGGGRTSVGAIRRTWAKHRRLRMWAGIMVVLAAAGLLADITVLVTTVDVPEWVTTVLRLVWSVGLGFGAAVISYDELMGNRELSRRYALMMPKLSQGVSDLDRAQASGLERAAQGVVRGVGTETLREASDWLALHSQRTVRPI